jgi:hypothetical protein
MFELGMRLAFDKPTIIIKDDRTEYTFDTGQIEHLGYPRDLRHSQIVNFKERLSEKIIATHKKATTDPSYTTFLKHFGSFRVSKLEEKEVSGQQFILEQLQSILIAVQRIPVGVVESAATPAGSGGLQWAKGDVNACMVGTSRNDVDKFANEIRTMSGVKGVAIENRSPIHQHLVIELQDALDESVTREVIGRLGVTARNIRSMKDGRFREIYKRPRKRLGAAS